MKRKQTKPPIPPTDDLLKDFEALQTNLPLSESLPEELPDVLEESSADQTAPQSFSPSTTPKTKVAQKIPDLPEHPFWQQMNPLKAASQKEPHTPDIAEDTTSQQTAATAETISKDPTELTDSDPPPTTSKLEETFHPAASDISPYESNQYLEMLVTKLEADEDDISTKVQAKSFPTGIVTAEAPDAQEPAEEIVEEITETVVNEAETVIDETKDIAPTIPSVTEDIPPETIITSEAEEASVAKETRPEDTVTAEAATTDTQATPARQQNTTTADEEPPVTAVEASSAQEPEEEIVEEITETAVNEVETAIEEIKDTAPTTPSVTEDITPEATITSEIDTTTEKTTSLAEEEQAAEAEASLTKEPSKDILAVLSDEESYAKDPDAFWEGPAPKDPEMSAEEDISETPTPHQQDAIDDKEPPLSVVEASDPETEKTTVEDITGTAVSKADSTTDETVTSMVADMLAEEDISAAETPTTSKTEDIPPEAATTSEAKEAIAIEETSITDPARADTPATPKDNQQEKITHEEFPLTKDEVFNIQSEGIDETSVSKPDTATEDTVVNLAADMLAEENLSVAETPTTSKTEDITPEDITPEAITTSEAKEAIAIEETSITDPARADTPATPIPYQQDAIVDEEIPLSVAEAPDPQVEKTTAEENTETAVSGIEAATEHTVATLLTEEEQAVGAEASIAKDSSEDMFAVLPDDDDSLTIGSDFCGERPIPKEQEITAVDMLAEEDISETEDIAPKVTITSEADEAAVIEKTHPKDTVTTRPATAETPVAPTLSQQDKITYEEFLSSEGAPVPATEKSSLWRNFWRRKKSSPSDSLADDESPFTLKNDAVHQTVPADTGSPPDTVSATPFGQTPQVTQTDQINSIDQIDDQENGWEPPTEPLIADIPQQPIKTATGQGNDRGTNQHPPLKSFPQTNPLLEIRLPAICEIGQARISFKDLLHLHEGMVIPLHQTPHGLMQLSTGDKTIALAEATQQTANDRPRIRIRQILRNPSHSPSSPILTG